MDMYRCNLYRSTNRCGLNESTQFMYRCDFVNTHNVHQ